MAPKLLPGEYRRRSLVTVEMDRLEAQVFAPEKLAEQEKINPGRALLDSVGVEDHYIVSTHRLDKTWSKDGQKRRLYLPVEEVTLEEE